MRHARSSTSPKVSVRSVPSRPVLECGPSRSPDEGQVEEIAEEHERRTIAHRSPGKSAFAMTTWSIRFAALAVFA